MCSVYERTRVHGVYTRVHLGIVTWCGLQCYFINRHFVVVPRVVRLVFSIILRCVRETGKFASYLTHPSAWLVFAVQARIDELIRCPGCQTVMECAYGRFREIYRYMSNGIERRSQRLLSADIQLAESRISPAIGKGGREEESERVRKREKK